MTPMIRRILPLAGAMALALAVVVGTALAGGSAADHRTDRADQARADAPGLAHAENVNADETEENADEADGAVDPQRFVDRLAAVGIEADPAAFAALVDRLGVGGAVRAFAWASALSDAGTATTAEQVADAFEATPGWGRLARELDPEGTAGLRPGIGWIMRGDAGDDASDDAADDATGFGRPDDPGAHGRSRAAAAGADHP